jgi:hypothetical protein
MKEFSNPLGSGLNLRMVGFVAHPQAQAATNHLFSEYPTDAHSVLDARHETRTLGYLYLGKT